MANQDQVPPPNWRALPPPLSNFVHQASTLPRLPVPPLARTLHKFKDLCRVGCSEEDFATLCSKIDEFGRDGGAGAALQQVLLKRKDETDNWMEEIWDEGQYLLQRGPLAIIESNCASFKPQPAHLPQTPAGCAAALTYAAMLFRQRVRSGKLAPDIVQGVELCMEAYRWLFDSYRVPGTQDIDWIVSHAGSSNPDSDLGHVIVIRKNRFWKLKAQVGQEVLGIGDLIRQFEYIYDHTTDEYPAIGALTCQDRDTWATDYEHLSSVPRNVDIFREIHSSAFVVSLDDSMPPPGDDVEVMKALWLGTYPSPANPGAVSRGFSSRCVDKACMFIVFDNCVTGFMGEHTKVDGTQYNRFMDEILGFLADPKSEFKLTPTRSIATTPEPLDFDLTSLPEIHGAIAKAEQLVQDLASSRVLSIVKTSYGKAAIKAFGVGPDGWAQMVMQVAYARLAETFGHPNGPLRPWPASAFEVVMTRRFYKGRGEVVNVVTDECVAFVKAMLGDEATKDDKVRLLRDATKRHQALVFEATRAEGVCQHLGGLEAMAYTLMSEEPLFEDPVYRRWWEMTLFTSSLPTTHIRLHGWCPPEEEDFGVAYLTGFDDHLCFTITSSNTLPNAALAEEIKKAADEFYELFSGSSQPESVLFQAKERGTSTRHAKA